MRPRLISLTLLVVLSAVAALLAETVTTPGPAKAQSIERKLSYHVNSPTTALPSTLDPHQFSESNAAVLAYSLAARIKEILYQVPCYCPCDVEQGHTSLLDCFVSKHGSVCRICQQEAVFCFRQRVKGQTASQIREEIANGKAWKVDLPK